MAALGYHFDFLAFDEITKADRALLVLEAKTAITICSSFNGLSRAVGAHTIVKSKSYCDLVQLRISINLREMLVLIIFIHIVLVAVGKKRVRQNFGKTTPTPLFLKILAIAP